MYNDSELREIYGLIIKFCHLEKYKELQPYEYILRIIFNDTLLFDKFDDVDSFNKSCIFIRKVINLVIRIPIDKVELVTHHLIFNNYFENTPDDFDYLDYLRVLLFPDECIKENFINYLSMFYYIFNNAASVYAAKVDLMRYNDLDKLIESFFQRTYINENISLLISEVLASIFYQDMRLFKEEYVKEFFDNYDYYTAHITMNFELYRNVSIKDMLFYPNGDKILLFVYKELNRIIIEIANKKNKKLIK